VNQAQRAFTLIEVTLAVVVITMGLLGLFGLGQLAMHNAKALEDDTRSALLAEDVFATLRSYSETLCASNNPALWAAFWTAFADPDPDRRTDLPLTLAHATCFANQDDNTISTDGEHTLHLLSRPETRGYDLKIPEWSARWSLHLQFPDITSPLGTNLVYITLRVKPGLQGEPGTARTYYTHLSEHGTLP
jgi:prepilin-type N-terminal cleavage/methylation domain-containing protein